MEAIYDKIGDDYDTTRKADPVILKELKRLLSIQDSKAYLDVACGTGNYTAEIAKSGGTWHAFDNSWKMLNEAQSKTHIVKFKQYTVEHLGYDSSIFDGAICSLAIHHFPNLTLAFSEVARVLKSQAKFIIFTATPEQMRSYWLCQYFPLMMERSCEQMPTLVEVEDSLLKSGMILNSKHSFFITPNLQDFFLYSGKQRPQMYLSEKVRRGISSFRKFCTQAELEACMEKLHTDIMSGDIFEIARECQSSIGDYLFIEATKC